MKESELWEQEQKIEDAMLNDKTSCDASIDFDFLDFVLLLSFLLSPSSCGGLQSVKVQKRSRHVRRE